MGKKSEENGRSELKFEKKLRFYNLVRSTVAQKAIAKENQKSKRRRRKNSKAYDLSSLSEYLPELNEARSKPVDIKLNSKRRTNVVVKEGNQLKMVINHPIFQSDPLGAIYKHLQNTQPVTDEKPKKKGNKTGKSKEKRNRKSKALSQPSMET